jgi:hypothetical protein
VLHPLNCFLCRKPLMAELFQIWDMSLGWTHQGCAGQVISTMRHDKEVDQ